MDGTQDGNIVGFCRTDRQLAFGKYFGRCPVGAAQCLHPNVLASALANKLASIAWTVLAEEHSSESRVSKVAA